MFIRVWLYFILMLMIATAKYKQFVYSLLSGLASCQPQQAQRIQSNIQEHDRCIVRKNVSSHTSCGAGKCEHVRIYTSTPAIRCYNEI